MKNLIFLLWAGICLSGCWEKKEIIPAEESKIVQVSTINALLMGAYDGQMTFEKLLSYGNFGLGTFDSLDGEMLVMDGKIYQIKSDGKVYHPAPTTKTPFASVISFRGENKISVTQPMDFANFTAEMDKNFSNKNIFYAFKLKGHFSKMKTRSVPAQTKPYPPLVEVTKNQPVFERENVSGTMIGFRSPDYAKTLTVPGYHLHFVADDESCGGHILDFVVDNGTVEVQPIYQFSLILPREEGYFEKMDISTDRSNELQKAEREH